MPNQPTSQPYPPPQRGSEPAPKKGKLRTYKILAGKHTQKDDAGVLHTFQANTPTAVFKSRTDLVKKFNTLSSRKFEYMDGEEGGEESGDADDDEEPATVRTKPRAVPPPASKAPAPTPHTGGSVPAVSPVAAHASPAPHEVAVSASVSSPTPGPATAPVTPPAAPTADQAKVSVLAGKNLNTMNVAELQAMAAEAKVDLKGETKKEKIVALLRQSS